MIYIYEHPKTGKQIEIWQDINDVHEYFDKKGLKWNRVFTAPFVSIDSKIDEFSAVDFANKTRNKNDNVGALMDRSRELSEKRASRNGGVDPVKEKFFSDYAKKRRNKLHPSDPKRYKKLNKIGVSL